MPVLALSVLTDRVKQLSEIRFVRFSTKERTFFAKRLAFLMRAGIPLIDALTLIRNQTKEKSKVEIYDAIIKDVTAGQYLSTSLTRFPRHFSEFTINVIRTGEHAGVLSENLRFLADELTKKHALEKKIRGALVYPLFISATTLGVAGLLTVFIFPKIMPIFLSLEIELPLSTRVLLAISTFLKNYGLHLLVGISGIATAFLAFRSDWTLLRYATDRALLRMPIAGEIARSYNTANFCRTLALLLNAGLPLTDSLEITARVMQNVVYRDAVGRILSETIKGKPMSRQLAEESLLFRDMVPHMIAIGESSGSLIETLTYLSELYEGEVDEKTRNLSSSIEPILLVSMGIIVSLIAVSVVTPIYDITRHIQR